MPTLKELPYLARDFWRISRGVDYFHRGQGLGAYFKDPRCYYLDLTGKTMWTGAFVDDVPAIYVPAWGRHVTLPVMVIQYGLGCIDRFLLEGDAAALEGVRRVSSWIPRSLRPEGFLDNRFQELHPSEPFWSNNSALTQGEALSFCVRVIRTAMAASAVVEDLRAAIEVIVRNMIRPLEEGGTVLRRGEDVFLCEFCRKDDYVVLNGWILGSFGLRDYLEYRKDAAAGSVLDATVRTLVRVLPDYLLPNGWTYYDNKRLICSPFYHASHISLLDALHRLTKEPEVRTALERCRRANRSLNRVRYTLVRAAGKLRERTLFAGEA